MKTVTKQIEEIVEAVCDKICKYPKLYASEPDEMKLEEACSKCPLSRL